MEKTVLKGTGLCEGIATGMALVCPDSIQGWAGVDDKTGVIIEHGHIHEGLSIKGRILILPGSRGSNGWSCHFYATKISGASPAGWIVTNMDSKIGVTLTVMDAPSVLYQDGELYKLIKTGDIVTINGGDGTITLGNG